MGKGSTTFRVQKDGQTGAFSPGTLRTQKTPSGNTVITVSRQSYSSGLSAASKVISSKTPPKK